MDRVVMTRGGGQAVPEAGGLATTPARLHAAPDAEAESVRVALQQARRALAQAAPLQVLQLCPPEMREARLHRADGLTRQAPHGPTTAAWQLPERLRLVELMLGGADAHSAQCAEFELLLAVGHCAQAHLRWLEAHEDWVLVRRLTEQARSWRVSDCGLAPWAELRERQLVTLQADMQAARTALELSTQRLSGGPCEGASQPAPSGL